MSKFLTEQKTPGSAHLNNTVGVLCLGGSALDFYYRRNLGTVIGGVGFGALYLASAYMLTQGYDQFGHDTAVVASSAMSIVFAPRNFGHKLMPDSQAWSIVAVGTATLAYNLYKSMQTRGLSN